MDIQHVLPYWTGCLFEHTHTHHVPLPSLHEYTIPHHWMPLSRQTALTYSRIPFHNKRYPRLLTIMHIVCMQCSTSFQYTACTHSSTAFQYSRYLTLQTWLRTHTLLRTDWSYTPTQQVLIAAYHSNTPLLHRTGQVSKHSLCSELGRYQNTHKRCRGLGKCINTPCAQDWTRYKNTHSAQGWTSAKTHRECIGLNKELQHSVHRTTQVQEHAECA